MLSKSLSGLRPPKYLTRTPFRRCFSRESTYLRISEEVRQALSENKPVVALESTIYTHGFPYPENIALATHLESVVRSNGGVPATVGILDGVARVGMDADEITRLAGSSGRPDTLKVSRRDLGFACGLGSPGRRYNGGTTVAGTMILAHLAGIKVFATGGLGGVHRGAESSMDISADLTELGRTPVAVISSGCKSFLDIPRTLEYLETEGVAVATFADGRQHDVEFPAFWTRDSGFKSPMKLQDEAEAATIIHASHSLGLQSGFLFANPIPTEYSIAKEEMDRVIDEAISNAEKAGATGNANTPYILAAIKDLTGSSSVTANRALVAANVERGTAVAAELAKLQSQNGSVRPSSYQPAAQVIGPGAANYTSSGVSKGVKQEIPSQPAPPLIKKPSENAADASIFVAGSLAVDFACDYTPLTSDESLSPATHTSNPAHITQSLGGVAHNVARSIQLLGGKVRLCSAVGNDLSGKAALEALSSEGLERTSIKTLDGARTAQYIAVNDTQKDLVLAMADMDVLSSSIKSKRAGSSAIEKTFEDFWRPQIQQARPSNIVVDANWEPDMLARWLSTAQSMSSHVSFEPVSTAKATRIFSLPKTTGLSVWPKPLINLTAPNTYELASLHSAARTQSFLDRDDWWQVIDALGIPSTGMRAQLALATDPSLVDSGTPQQSIQLLPFIPQILTKMGSRGVLLTQIIPAGDPRLTSGEYAPYILSRCTNGTEETTGVGGLYMRLFPAVEQVSEDDIASVNGVGDTFLGAIIAGLQQKGKDARVEDVVDFAQQAAVLTLKSKEAVSPGISSLKSLM